jgi:hypothetical protein
MKRQGLMGRCLALALVGALLLACSPSSPPPLTVDDIVAAHVAARGGEERLKALGSIRESGTVTGSGGKVAQVVLELARPGRIRLEFAFQGTVSVFAHDGETGWQVAPLQGQFEPQVTGPANHAVAGVDQRDVEGPLLGWRDKGYRVELVGRERLPSGEAFKLEVTLAGGAVRHHYIDVATHHLVRTDITRVGMIDGQTVELQNTYSDFRDVEGIVFPYVIESRAEDRPEVITVNVETIELDPDLDEARFHFPQ